MKLTGAQILIETLIEQEIKTVFGYPGGTVLHIYDELYKNAERIHHIITAHEQGACHAADGYARSSGKVGVVIATSGPGATNLVTGIANAYLDSVPMVAITGNVPTAMFGKDAFQEVDIFGVTMPITKHNYLVERVEDLAPTLREAFAVAKSGRPGPVLVDIPKDVQMAATEFLAGTVSEVAPFPRFFHDQIVKAVALIGQAERPYIYCGGGILASNASEEVLALAEAVDGVIGQSMMGLSAVPTTHERVLGMTGMHGHAASTRAMYASDLIIALGIRFSDRATGNKERFMRDKNIIHIDIDDAEINKNITTTLGIAGNVKDVLTEILDILPPVKKDAWQETIASFRQHELDNPPPFKEGLNPYQILDCINAKKDADMPVATDVGQHQLWTSQRIALGKPRTYLSSGGLGTMGYGMGAAMGACVATGKRTILVTGDGSFGMNLNEMATAVSQNMPLVVVIMDNGVLGNVRQWQRMFFDSRFAETTLNRKTDFVKLAEAFGAVGFYATSAEEMKEALDKAFAINGPVIIDAIIDKDNSVFPMIPPNASIENLLLK